MGQRSCGGTTSTRWRRRSRQTWGSVPAPMLMSLPRSASTCIRPSTSSSRAHDGGRSDERRPKDLRRRVVQHRPDLPRSPPPQAGRDPRGTLLPPGLRRQGSQPGGDGGEDTTYLRVDDERFSGVAPIFVDDSAPNLIGIIPGADPWPSPAYV